MDIVILCCAKLPRLPKPIWILITSYIPHFSAIYPKLKYLVHERTFIESACVLNRPELLSSDRALLNLFFAEKHGRRNIADLYNYVIPKNGTVTIYEFIMLKRIGKYRDRSDFEILKTLDIVSIARAISGQLEKMPIKLVRSCRFLMDHVDLLGAICHMFWDNSIFRHYYIISVCKAGNVELFAKIEKKHLKKTIYIKVAIAGGSIYIVKTLLPKKIETNLYHWIYIALFKNRVAVVLYLQSLGYHISVAGAAYGGHIETVKKLSGCVSENSQKYLEIAGFTKKY